MLPPFAKWSPDDWKSKGEESADIVKQQLGWDITDFGTEEFEKFGLLLFTIRNGSFEELSKPFGKIYAEKAMIVKEEQITPIHFHSQKMEDIINRRTWIQRPPQYELGGIEYSFPGREDVPVDLWTYDFGSHKLMMRVRFVAEQVQSITPLD